MDNLNIVYNYHLHDGDGTYESTCYSAIYHTHINACKITCGGTYYATAEGVQQSSGGWDAPIKCQRCGATNTWVSSGAQQDVGDKFTRFKCSKVTGYSCGLNNEKLEGYEITCGKTTDTIESATVIY